MKPNVGEKESYIRIGVGILSAIAAFKVDSKVTSALLGAVAASAIETGLSRYCLFNALLGVDHAPGLIESPVKAVVHVGEKLKDKTHSYH